MARKLPPPHDLAVRVAAVAPGTQVTIGFVRAGKAQTATTKIGNLASATGDAGKTASTAGGQHLGVALAPLNRDTRQQLGLPQDTHGVVVSDVEAGSPADQAGIRPGDVIQSVGGQQVDMPKAAVSLVKTAMAAKKTGAAAYSAGWAISVHCHFSRWQYRRPAIG
jgi:serine protease Do